MSSLTAVLAGDVAPGVHRWRSGLEAEDVAETVRRTGRAFGHVDGWLATTKAEVLDAIGAALGFPDHFGRNFDALADCLRDLAEDTVLLWDGWGTLAADDERSFAILLDVLQERTQDRVGPRFDVVLRGAGPELAQLPTLE
ncbi:RNAse (barnase) inhibitor barstar [Nocardioides daedukensis]|uniref:RNAse (Barnase) inhibitor barstar n=1 Tax=Nocardioides daedukensis TaxID=634462 RepID=A0A7Y9S0P2_9ACTN|nr:barstar family protein [Nocardioides daedukensis]NYG57998.1 RNAse (barnase) inhibitor barstar [Nocardioides daedukensis]